MRKSTQFLFTSLCVLLLFPATSSFAAPFLKTSQELSDKNTEISFEVHAPWNILDGKAEQSSGHLALVGDKSPPDLQANLAVESIDYSAGVSVAGRLVAGWLRLNSPTPAKFSITKSSIKCNAAKTVAHKRCSGSVDGTLTIWAKDYTIDVPVEVKPSKNGALLKGAKEIKWGEYGFGDPDSSIASLKPVIKLNFAIELASNT